MQPAVSAKLWYYCAFNQLVLKTSSLYIPNKAEAACLLTWYPSHYYILSKINTHEHTLSFLSKQRRYHRTHNRATKSSLHIFFPNQELLSHSCSSKNLFCLLLTLSPLLPLPQNCRNLGLPRVALYPFLCKSVQALFQGFINVVRALGILMVVEQFCIMVVVVVNMNLHIR